MKLALRQLIRKPYACTSDFGKKRYTTNKMSSNSCSIKLLRENYLSIINFHITYRFYIDITLSLVHLLTKKMPEDIYMCWGVLQCGVTKWKAFAVGSICLQCVPMKHQPVFDLERRKGDHWKQTHCSGEMGNTWQKYSAKAENGLLNQLYLKHTVNFGSKMYLKVLTLQSNNTEIYFFKNFVESTFKFSMVFFSSFLNWG